MKSNKITLEVNGKKISTSAEELANIAVPLHIELRALKVIAQSNYAYIQALMRTVGDDLGYTVKDFQELVENNAVAIDESFQKYWAACVSILKNLHSADKKSSAQEGKAK